MPIKYQVPTLIIKKRYNRKAVNNLAIFGTITKNAASLIPLNIKEIVLEIHPETLYDPLIIVIRTPSLTDRHLSTLTKGYKCSYTRSFSKTFDNDITDQVKEGEYELVMIDSDLWHASLILK